MVIHHRKHDHVHYRDITVSWDWFSPCLWRRCRISSISSRLRKMRSFPSLNRWNSPFIRWHTSGWVMPRIWPISRCFRLRFSRSRSTWIPILPRVNSSSASSKSRSANTLPLLSSKIGSYVMVIVLLLVHLYSVV